MLFRSPGHTTWAHPARPMADPRDSPSRVQRAKRPEAPLLGLRPVGGGVGAVEGPEEGNEKGKARSEHMRRAAEGGA